MDCGVDVIGRITHEMELIDKKKETLGIVLGSH